MYKLFEQIVEIVHRFVENNVVFIKLIFNCKFKLNSTTYDDGYRRDSRVKWTIGIISFYNPIEIKKRRHPEDVKIHTDETGRNTERNYIIRAKCIEGYIMALCL